MNSTSPIVDDIEKTVDNDPELDEYLLKIYEKNMEKINTIQKVIKIAQLTGIFSFLIFLIIIAIRVNSISFAFSWFYMLIPTIICLLSFTIVINMFLKLKDIFDEAEKFRDEDESSQIGSIVSYFCLNVNSLNILVYLILFSLKLENIIDAQFNVISVPLYVFLGVSLFYSIFILPAFTQNKLYSEIIMIFVYIISSFTFLILLNFKLDLNLNGQFLNIFIPVFFSLGLHLIYLILFLHQV